MLLIFLIGAIVLGAIAAVLYGDERWGWRALAGVASGVLVALFVAAIISTCSYVGEYGNMRGFYQSLPVAIDAAQRIEKSYYASQPNIPGAVNLDGLANVKQSTNLSDAWAELRDSIIRYNKQLAANKAWSDNFFCRAFVPRPPADLRPIDWKQMFQKDEGR